jgi:hypothetical protein
LVRRVLAIGGLESFVKTTGGEGLHVVAPLAPQHHWTQCYELSRAVADAIVRVDPSRYTTSVKKAGRQRKILIDYLRNNRTGRGLFDASEVERDGLRAPRLGRAVAIDAEPLHGPIRARKTASAAKRSLGALLRARAAIRPVDDFGVRRRALTGLPRHRFETIWLATGFAPAIERLEWLHGLGPLQCHRGRPILPPSLELAPHCFASGWLAELEVGPQHLRGTQRRGADRGVRHRRGPYEERGMSL